MSVVDPESAPSRVHTHPLRSALVAVLAGMAMSALAWVLIASWEDRTERAEFDRRAEDQVRRLQSGFDGYISRLRGLRSFFHATENVSREAFTIFANELFRERPGILSFSWSPRVTDAERAGHESTAVREGLSGYSITALNAENKEYSSPRRDEYFPTFYSTLPLTSSAYGVDLHDGGVRQSALDYARDHDVPATSATLQLQSGSGDGTGFYTVLPVYRKGAPHETIEDRRLNIAGFVRAVFQFHIISDAVLNPIKKPLDFFVFDTNAAPSQLPVYVREDGKTSDSRVANGYVMAADQKFIGELQVGTRQWQVVLVPDEPGSVFSRYSRASIVAGAGLLITLLAGIYVWTTLRNMRRLHAANAAISELARTDVLTGLANRRAFVERLDLAFASAARDGPYFAVLFLDLDGFKSVNDTHGHAIGDVLLKQVAARLSHLVRASDLVARFGGDEFAILQSSVAGTSSSHTLAAKTVQALGEPYELDGKTIHVTASIGITLFSAKSHDTASLLMQADLALYLAKAGGRNGYRFYSVDTVGDAVHADIQSRSSAA